MMPLVFSKSTNAETKTIRVQSTMQNVNKPFTDKNANSAVENNYMQYNMFGRLMNSKKCNSCPRQ